MRRLLLLALLSGCITASGPGFSSGTGEAPDLGALHHMVHRAANDARRAEGIGVLAWSDDLAAIAEDHSRDMAARNYFGHVTPDGVSPQDRAVAGGVDCRVRVVGGTMVGVSENLYTSTRYHRVRTRTHQGRKTRTVDWFAPQDLARRTVQGWLDSAGHRRNLLKTTVSAHGIGVATDQSRVYVTQVLC